MVTLWTESMDRVSRSSSFNHALVDQQQTHRCFNFVCIIKPQTSYLTNSCKLTLRPVLALFKILTTASVFAIPDQECTVACAAERLVFNVTLLMQHCNRALCRYSCGWQFGKVIFIAVIILVLKPHTTLFNMLQSVSPTL